MMTEMKTTANKNYMSVAVSVLTTSQVARTAAVRLDRKSPAIIIVSYMQPLSNNFNTLKL
jgi:hypothetical protein